VDNGYGGYLRYLPVGGNQTRAIEIRQAAGR